MKKMGLTWAPIDRAKRMYASYRIQSIKDYLIGLNAHLVAMKKGESTDVFLFC